MAINHNKIDLLQVWAGKGKTEEIDSSKIDIGWMGVETDYAYSQMVNWLQQRVELKANQLINAVNYIGRAGIMEWGSTVQYSVGDVVVYSDVAEDTYGIYQAKTVQSSGADHAPTARADNDWWTYVMTFSEVKALTDQLTDLVNEKADDANVVKLMGNQTINGIKSMADTLQILGDITPSDDLGAININLKNDKVNEVKIVNNPNIGDSHLDTSISFSTKEGIVTTYQGKIGSVGDTTKLAITADEIMLRSMDTTSGSVKATVSDDGKTLIPNPVKITNLDTPKSTLDAANKRYVDNADKRDYNDLLQRIENIPAGGGGGGGGGEYPPPPWTGIVAVNIPQSCIDGNRGSYYIWQQGNDGTEWSFTRIFPEWKGGDNIIHGGGTDGGTGGGGDGGTDGGTPPPPPKPPKPVALPIKKLSIKMFSASGYGGSYLNFDMKDSKDTLYTYKDIVVKDSYLNGSYTACIDGKEIKCTVTSEGAPYSNRAWNKPMLKPNIFNSANSMIAREYLINRGDGEVHFDFETPIDVKEVGLCTGVWSTHINDKMTMAMVYSDGTEKTIDVKLQTTAEALKEQTWIYVSNIPKEGEPTVVDEQAQARMMRRATRMALASTPNTGGVQPPPTLPYEQTIYIPRVRNKGWDSYESGQWFYRMQRRINSYDNNDVITKMFSQMIPYKNMKRMVLGAQWSPQEGGNKLIPYYTGMCKKIVDLPSGTQFSNHIDMGGGVTNPFYDVVVPIDGFHHIMCEIWDSVDSNHYKIYAMGEHGFYLDPMRDIPYVRQDVKLDEIEIKVHMPMDTTSNSSLYMGAFYPTKNDDNTRVRFDNPRKFIYSIPSLQDAKFDEVWDTSAYPYKWSAALPKARGKGFLYGAFLQAASSLAGMSSPMTVSQEGYFPSNMNGDNNLKMRQLCTYKYNQYMSKWEKGDGHNGLYTTPMSSIWHTTTLIRLLYIIEKGNWANDETYWDKSIQYPSKWAFGFEQKGNGSSWVMKTGVTGVLGNETGVYVSDAQTYSVNSGLDVDLSTWRGIEAVCGWAWEWNDTIIQDGYPWFPVPKVVEEADGTKRDAWVKYGASTYLFPWEEAENTPYANGKPDARYAIKFPKLIYDNAGYYFADMVAGSFIPSYRVQVGVNVGAIGEAWYNYGGTKSLFLYGQDRSQMNIFTWSSSSAPSHVYWYDVPRLVVLP